MQKQFEEWRLSVVENSDLQKDGAVYFDHDVHSDWQAWQASRAALVFSTGELPEASYGGAGVVYLSAVESMLDEAGVKYE